ncbi:hypothetical protein J2X43_002594 [Rhizobium sp. BE258]|nr:hypothetical protein [Rhizobium sp. BE258]
MASERRRYGFEAAPFVSVTGSDVMNAAIRLAVFSGASICGM